MSLHTYNFVISIATNPTTYRCNHFQSHNASTELPTPLQNTTIEQSTIQPIWSHCYTQHVAKSMLDVAPSLAPYPTHFDMPILAVHLSPTSCTELDFTLQHTTLSLGTNSHAPSTHSRQATNASSADGSTDSYLCNVDYIGMDSAPAHDALCVKPTSRQTIIS